MRLTDKQIYDLNNMNVAAQNVGLGDLLSSLLEGGGGGGTGSTNLISRESYLNFPKLGNENNLYIDTGTNTIYRWDNNSSKYYMVGSGIDNIIDNFEIINGGNANG